jgi:hypothetical protein
MTDRLCLRCDWHGDARDPTCPNCGEPLYTVGAEPQRVPVPPEHRPGRLAMGDDPEGRITGSAAPASSTGSTKRSRRGIVAFVVGALVLATVVGTWLDTHQQPRRPRARPAASGLVGTLVYAVRENGAWSRLYRWDLATDQVRRGPRVPRVVELVNADGANFGWVGATSVLADGHLQAGVLRFLGPNDRVTPVLTGDLVAWGPRGDSVVAVHRGPERPICRRRVSIVWATLVPALRDRQFLAPHLCGDIWSVGRDENVTYFTLVRDGRMDIVYAGIRRVHEVLGRHALMSVSPLSDLLVVDGAAFQAAGKGPLRPDGEPREVTGAALFFRGLQPHRAIAFASDGYRFALDRVLAWSPNASTAIVSGRLGPRTGVFELRTGPEPGPRAPNYLGPDPGIAYATYLETGTAIVETADGLFLDRSGSLVPLAPPAGAPAVDGPIAWIR